MSEEEVDIGSVASAEITVRALIAAAMGPLRPLRSCDTTRRASSGPMCGTSRYGPVEGRINSEHRRAYSSIARAKVRRG